MTGLLPLTPAERLILLAVSLIFGRLNTLVKF